MALGSKRSLCTCSWSHPLVLVGAARLGSSEARLTFHQSRALGGGHTGEPLNRVGVTHTGMELLWGSTLREVTSAA